MLNRLTGENFPARCKANFCPWCGPVNASLIGGAIALARPERAILITQVGNDWQTTRHRTRELAYRIRRRAKRNLNWCWHVEPNPEGTGHHLHGWQWGDFIPQRILSDLAASVGMGRVAFINKIRSKPGQPVGYGMKMAGVAYGLKMAEAAETMDAYLEANGNRLVHASRGFWRDGEGKAYPGQREAMSAWASRNRSASDEDQGEWVLVREDQVHEALRGLAGSSSR